MELRSSVSLPSHRTVCSQAPNSASPDWGKGWVVRTVYSLVLPPPTPASGSATAQSWSLGTAPELGSSTCTAEQIYGTHICNQHVVYLAAFLVINLGHQLPAVGERCQEGSQRELVPVPSSHPATVRIFSHDHMERGNHVVQKLGIFPALWRGVKPHKYILCIWFLL